MKEITFFNDSIITDIENNVDTLIFVSNYYKWGKHLYKNGNIKRKEYRQRGRFGRMLNSFDFKNN